MGCGCCSHVLSEQEVLRVAIFGLENSGKTSLVQCLKTTNQLFDTSKYNSTHGVVGVSVQSNSQIDFDLLLFDCGGCKHQRHMWPHLINNSDAILFVIDSFDLVCLNDAKQALSDLLTHENLSGKPLLIVFTKSDKYKHLNIIQLEQEMNLCMIKDRPIHQILFSSVTLDGLSSIFTWFAHHNHYKILENNGRNDSKSFSIGYRLSKSLNLSTQSMTFPSKTVTTTKTVTTSN